MPLTVVDGGMLSATNAQYTMFKNRLINGGMGIWQRGTTTSTNGAYLADRWSVYSNSGTITGSRSTDVPANFQYSFSASGTGYPQVTQRIEAVNCLDLSGQTITVSFWAKQTSGAGAGSIGVQLTYAGSSDNWTAPVVIGTNPTFTGTTGWVQYSATYTNLPSNVLNGLAVTVYGNTVGSATVLFTGVQLEKGSTATSFDYRPYGTELQLCQRYCLRLTDSTNNFTMYGSFTAASATLAYGAIQGTTMRVTPTVTYSSLALATNAVFPVTSIGAYGGLVNGVIPIQINVASGLTVGSSVFLQQNNSASAFLQLSAEL